MVTISAHAASYVYSNTSAESPLRRFCVEDLAHELWCPDTITCIPNSYNLDYISNLCSEHSDFFKGYFIYLQDKTTDGDTPHSPRLYLDACKFHCHAEGDNCYMRFKVTQRESFQSIRAEEFSQ